MRLTKSPRMKTFGHEHSRGFTEKVIDKRRICPKITRFGPLEDRKSNGELIALAAERRSHDVDIYYGENTSGIRHE